MPGFTGGSKRAMTDTTIARLLRAAATEARLREKTDEEIADELLHTVWAELDITSVHSCLIEHAIERLHRAKGGPLPAPKEDDDAST